MTQHVYQRTRLHFGDAKQIEQNFSSTGNLDLQKVRSHRSKVENTKQRMNHSAAIVPKEELQFINEITKYETKEQKRENVALLKQYKEQQQLGSRNKQLRMQELDKLRATKLPPSEQEVRDQVAKEQIISRAQQLLDEEQDDVKKMNSMVLYSKVVTIRDQQLRENRRLQQRWKDEQHRLDMEMEIARLKDL